MNTNSRKINLTLSMFTVGFWTLGSRFFGFLRDILMASFLGSGVVAEAFLIAFTLPNMFRRFFAEGALNSALVPMLSKHLNDVKSLKFFAGNIISWLLILLILLIIIAEIFMPQLVMLLASGFIGSEKFELSVGYGRVMFPYIFLISIGSAFGAILNSLGFFKITAAAPILLNIILIVALVVSKFMQLDIGWMITFAVPLAGVLQMTCIILVCYYKGVMPKISLPKINTDTKKFLLLAGPAILAGGVVQINLLIGRQISSFFDGAVAWLSYADRIYQLPLGVVGIALGVVLLPDLSRKFKSNDSLEAEETINKAILLSLSLVIPATIALMIIPDSIIRVLFERGAFEPVDTRYTADALFIFAIGLPAFVLHKIFLPIFFSKDNTKTPFQIALVCMLANLIISLALIKTLGFLATAMGTTISSWLMLYLLIHFAKKYSLNFDRNKRLVKAIFGIIFCSAIMGIFLYYADLYLYNAYNYGLAKYLAFLFLIGSAACMYLLSLYLLGFKKYLNYFLEKGLKASDE